MYLNNPEVVNQLAHEKLADLRQEAAIHRRFHPLKKSYRSSLASLLKQFAERLEPNSKSIDTVNG